MPYTICVNRIDRPSTDPAIGTLATNLKNTALTQQVRNLPGFHGIVLAAGKASHGAVIFNSTTGALGAGVATLQGFWTGLGNLPAGAVAPTQTLVGTFDSANPNGTTDAWMVWVPPQGGFVSAVRRWFQDGVIVVRAVFQKLRLLPRERAT